MTTEQIAATTIAIERIIQYAHERAQRLARYERAWELRRTSERPLHWRRAGRTWRSM